MVIKATRNNFVKLNKQKLNMKYSWAKDREIKLPIPMSVEVQLTMMLYIV